MASSSLNHISLPFELTEEILSTIPIEYLIRFRLICKQWYSLLKNQQFIYKYLDLTQERFIRIDNTVQIIDPITQTRINSPLPTEFTHKPKISAMIHCDGLVLLKFSNFELGLRRLLIWNPILGQIKWIQPTRNIRTYSILDDFIEEGYNDDTYGIGYDNASRHDYKILRVYNRVYKEIYGNEIEIEIYDLNSNSWKFLEDTSDWFLIPSCKGVSVNGNMYWVAQRWINDGQIFIQSFDFSAETFKPRSNCLPFERHMLDVVALSSFKRDKLCLLHQFEESKEIEIWVSNKVDEEVMLWSKYLSVASPGMSRLYADSGFFIDKNDKIRVWCEDGIKEKEERLRFNLFDDYDYPFLSEYLPSLVPLPQ